MNIAERCTAPTEVFSRVVGFYRPIGIWNRGKAEEYFNRVEFNLSGAQKVLHADEGAEKVMRKIKEIKNLFVMGPDGICLWDRIGREQQEGHVMWLIESLEAVKQEKGRLLDKLVDKVYKDKTEKKHDSDIKV